MDNDDKTMERTAAVLALTDSEYEIEEVEQLSSIPYDIGVKGTHNAYGREIRFSAWLPLLAIRELTDWCDPEIAEMTDYPEMALDGDWSGVRDTNRDSILAIFDRFVLPRLTEVSTP